MAMNITTELVIRIFILMAVSQFTASIFSAQTPVTQVEGFLEVYHPIDTTSLYIGKWAGQEADINSNRFNTVVGSFAGDTITTGFATAIQALNEKLEHKNQELENEVATLKKLNEKLENQVHTISQRLLKLEKMLVGD